MSQIAEALRLLRVFHDLSQTELAERLSISKSFLSEVEAGKKEPTLNLLSRYSEKFSVPISSLLFFAERVESPGKSLGPTMVAPKVIALLDWIAKTKEPSANVRKKPPQREGAVKAKAQRRRSAN